MARPMKGVDMDRLTELVNKRLEMGDGGPTRLRHMTPEQAYRLALCDLLTTVQHETNRYAGFTYQRSEFLPAEEQTRENVLREGYDDTRRAYYVKPYKR
jgi:hypothetical protein